MCITGGVSMGDFDFVPGMLHDCGVRFVVQKMTIKPGRPTIFGVAPDGAPVFALPGNPVSTFVGFCLLARPALAAMQGRPRELPRAVAAKLRGTIAATGDRQSYSPARIDVGPDGTLTAQPLRWLGSGDPFGMAYADGMIVREAGAGPANDGETVRILLIEAL